MIAPLATETLSPDCSSLTSAEREELQQLELKVEQNLTGFLECGRCLLAIREKKLYRQTHHNWADYVRDRFGLGKGLCDHLCRSTETYETLVGNGVQIPASTPEGTIRPLSHLPGEDIQVAVWRLVEAAAPETGPNRTVVSRIVRIVKNAIVSASPDGRRPGQRERPTNFPPSELPFLRPLQKLSSWDKFDASMVVSHVESRQHAARISRACSTMIFRCSQVKTILAERFGERMQ